jgi:hypothetical protein
MTKTNKVDNNVSPVKKQRNFPRNIIYIALLVGVVVLLLVNKKLDFINNMLFDQEKNIEVAVDNELIQKALEKNYSAGAEPPILRFTPEESAQSNVDYTEEEIEEINPYVTIIEGEGDSSESTKEIMLNYNLNEYRLFIANANKLIDKFKANKNYELELEIFKKRQLPARVESVISLLELYNQQLIENKINTDNIVKPFNSKILAQFVTIKKIPVGQKEQNNLKTNLDILTDYIFSSELQDSFLSK